MYIFGFRILLKLKYLGFGLELFFQYLWTAKALLPQLVAAELLEVEFVLALVALSFEYYSKQ
jgi:hypothetical protein